MSVHASYCSCMLIFELLRHVTYYSYLKRILNHFLYSYKYAWYALCSVKILKKS